MSLACASTLPIIYIFAAVTNDTIVCEPSVVTVICHLLAGGDYVTNKGASEAGTCRERCSGLTVFC